MTLFRGKLDHEAFQRRLLETVDKAGMRMLGYCVMSNHRHIVLSPKADEPGHPGRIGG